MKTFELLLLPSSAETQAPAGNSQTSQGIPEPHEEELDTGYQPAVTSLV